MVPLFFEVARGPTSSDSDLIEFDDSCGSPFAPQSESLESRYGI